MLEDSIPHLISSNLSVIQSFYSWKAHTQVIKLPEALKHIKNEANRKYSYFFISLSSEVNSLYSKQHELEAEIEEYTSRNRNTLSLQRNLELDLASVLEFL